MAFDADNKITAVKADTIANLGAYMSLFSSVVPTYLHAILYSGQYVIPAIHCNMRTAYHQHRTPVDAYRGAGRPETTYALERVVETAARELGVDAGRIAPQELHPPTVAVPDAGHPPVRFRRLRKGLARSRP